MGVGLCGVYGISPHLAKPLILTYVNPVALCGLEDSDITALDKYQCGLLQQIQSLTQIHSYPSHSPTY